jgi:hypothetical protein
MLSHHRELRDFLTNYGATSIAITYNGKHPKLEFDYKDQHRVVPIFASSSDPNALNHAKHDLIKMLGPPIEEPKREPRKLSDMIADPLPEPPPSEEEEPPKLDDAYTGAMAMYANGTGHTVPLRLRFMLPFQMAEDLNLEGKVLNVKRLDADTWQLSPSSGPKLDVWQTLVRRDRHRYIADCTAAEVIEGYGKFGVSPAEYIVVNDDLVVHLNPKTIRPVFVAANPPIRIKPPVQAAPSPADPPPLPVPTPPPEPTAPPPGNNGEIVTLDEYMRQILRMIARAEKISAHKLTRVRKDNGDNYWEWRAPVIRLEDYER